MSQTPSPLLDCSHHDRGLLYGDGLFETIRCNHNTIPLWPYHQQRLAQGLERLGFDAALLMHIEAKVFEQLSQPSLHASSSSASTSRDSNVNRLLKVVLTRGVGERGYAKPSYPTPNIWVDEYAPSPWGDERFEQGMSLEFSPVQLGLQPHLAGIKHLGRLEQVLARSQLNVTFDEAIMCDLNGHVIECTSANVYWQEGQQLFTPSLKHCGIDGVVRRWLQDQCSIKEVDDCTPQRLLDANAIWISNTVLGLVAVTRIGTRSLPTGGQLDTQQTALKALFATH